MEPKELLNIQKIAKKVKADNYETKLEIAKELNEIAKIIIELNHARKERNYDKQEN